MYCIDVLCDRYELSGRGATSRAGGRAFISSGGYATTPSTATTSDTLCQPEGAVLLGIGRNGGEGSV